MLLNMLETKLNSIQESFKENYKVIIESSSEDSAKIQIIDKECYDIITEVSLDENGLDIHIHSLFSSEWSDTEEMKRKLGRNVEILSKLKSLL